MNDSNLTITEWMEGWPEAALATDRDARVLAANALACGILQVAQPASIVGAAVIELLVRRFAGLPITPDSLDPQRPTEIEFNDGECERLLQITPCAGGDRARAGWLVVLADVTEQRRIQRRQDDAVRLMTHDLRSPQVTLLTLIELHRVDGSAMSSQRLLEAVQYHAQSSLDLVDDFAALVRAEARPLAPEPFDLADVVEGVADAEWSPQDGGLQVAWDISDRAAECLGDRRLVEQALAVLWRDAVRRCVRGAVMHGRIRDDGSLWTLHLAMARARAPTSGSAMRVSRLDSGDHKALLADPAFALAAVAARRHGGALQVAFSPADGWRVALSLAKATAARSSTSRSSR